MKQATRLDCGHLWEVREDGGWFCNDESVYYCHNCGYWCRTGHQPEGELDQESDAGRLLWALAGAGGEATPSSQRSIAWALDFTAERYLNALQELHARGMVGAA